MIEQRVSQFIEEKKLFCANDKLFVGLSGGSDSVALLCLLKSLGYVCEAGHCNFQLRGEEAERDQKFAAKLCLEKQIPFHTVRFNTKEYACTQKISIEMAARELRYNWFEKMRIETQSDYIAIAHHSDDNIETLLLNLIRGTGIKGLTGIKPRNGRIVRPLLCISRQEITDYLQTIKQDFVTDSSNLHDEFTRNKIRLNILPLLEQINPAVRQCITNTASYLADTERIYQHAIEEERLEVEEITSAEDEKHIKIDKLTEQPAPATLLYELISPLGFNAQQCKEIIASIKGQSGKIFESNKGWTLLKDRHLLIIKKIGLKDEGREKDILPFSLERTEYDYTPDFIILREKQYAYFDAALLKGRLIVRKWEAGDRFVPFGMKGSKLISDYLTDKKYSRLKKGQTYVLCCNDKIAWIIGERIDQRFSIDNNTKKIIAFKAIFK